MISNRNVVELLVTKNQNSRSICDFGGLPTSWENFKLKDFEQMIRNLDIEQNGSISYQMLATCCILLTSSIANDKDIEALVASLANEGSSINSDAFVARSSAWFEASQKSQDRENSLPFPRVSHIKQALFQVHSTNGVIDLERLATCLQLKENVATMPGAKTYLDLLVGV